MRGREGFRGAGVLARAVTILTALACAPAPAEFPMAGGNAQRTGYMDADGPIRAPEILWERPLGVPGISGTQPVIDPDGNILATASPINAERWEGPGEPQVVVVSFTPGGGERWRYVYTWDHARYPGTWSQLSGPVVVGDSVVVGHRYGVLRGLDRHSGDIRWSRDLSPGNEPITSTPVADRGGFVYVHCRDIPTIHKIAAATGAIQWTHRFIDGEDGRTSSPTLSPDEETLYIGRSLEEASYLYAVNTADGSFKWSWSPDAARGHSFAWTIPILAPDGSLYIQDEELAHLYAVRDMGETHALQWALHREGTGAPRLGAANAYGFFGQYTCASRGVPVVFHARGPGRDVWARTLETGKTGALLAARTALYFGMNGTGTVHALDPASGEPLWRRQVGTESASFSEGLALGNGGTLYAGVDGTPSRPGEASLVAMK